MKKRPSRGTTKPHGRQTKHEDKPKANSSKSEEETARPEKRITIEVDQMLRDTAKMARHHYRLYYGSNVLADSVRDTHQVALTIAEPEHHARVGAYRPVDPEERLMALVRALVRKASAHPVVPGRETVLQPVG